MTIRQFKLIATIATIIACLTLPFLMYILRSLYAIDVNDPLFEGFQRYKTDLIPARDVFVYSTLGLCLLLSTWNLLNHKAGRNTSRFDVVATLLFVITAALIILIKTLLPAGPLV